MHIISQQLDPNDSLILRIILSWGGRGSNGKLGPNIEQWGSFGLRIENGVPGMWGKGRLECLKMKCQGVSKVRAMNQSRAVPVARQYV